MNRLRLNASKTQLMWLSSTQLLDRITGTDISVIDTHAIVSESARDLGPRAVIGGAVEHVTAVCPIVVSIWKWTLGPIITILQIGSRSFKTP